MIFNKINFSALAMMLLFSLLFSLSSCDEATPQGFADVPECQDLATVKAWVFLTYVAEVHPDKPGLPSGYITAIKIPFEIEQIVPFTFKETDEAILGRLKSPWPGDFLIGEVKSYEIERKFCKEDPQDVPKDKPYPQKPDPQK